MKILVTGYPGFLATNLAYYLSKSKKESDDIVFTYRGCNLLPTPQCDNLSESQCDLLDYMDVYCLMNDLRPDVIIHLAASSDNSKGQSFEMFENNVKMTYNLLENCKNGTSFIFASSSAVYGDCMLEGMWEGALPNPTSLYGASKIACENLIDLYGYKVNGIKLRFPAIVGPYMTHGLLRDIIRKLDSDSPELELFGEAPGSIKPYLHVGDAIGAIIYATNTNYTGSFNISHDASAISVEDVAHLVMKTRNKYKPIKFLGESTVWQGDNKRVHMNSSLSLRYGFPEPMSCIDAIIKATEEN